MVKTSDRCNVGMFCLVYSISRHGLLKDITNFVFEWETTKNSGQPTQFLGFGIKLFDFQILQATPSVCVSGLLLTAIQFQA